MGLDRSAADRQPYAPSRGWTRVDRSRLRTTLTLAGGVFLGVLWLTVAFLAQFRPDFVLYRPFHSLGIAFWGGFTILGLALTGTMGWAALSSAPAIVAPTAVPRPSAVEPVAKAAGWDSVAQRSKDRDACARCGRTLPLWRVPEGTCTVCAPYSVFLDPPKVASPELEKRRNTLFLLQGLGIALLALAFVAAVYLFPIVLAPQRPALATLGFLVFSPLLFGLVLLMYAQNQHSADLAD
jgi:hypothetical protein